MKADDIVFSFLSRKLKLELVDNALKVMAFTEKCLGYEFSWVISKNKFVEIENRSEWLIKEVKKEDELISIYNVVKNELIANISFSDNFDPFLEARLDTTLILPIECKRNGFEVFLNSCSLIEAFRGNAYSPKMKGILNKQKLFHHQKPIPPYGLPPVLVPRKSTYGFHEFPFSVSWLNFWSPLMLQNIAYQHQKHQHLFYRVAQLENGTIFQVTEEPTDPEIPEHLEKLLAVYKAFPKIGGRHLIKGVDFGSFSESK